MCDILWADPVEHDKGNFTDKGQLFEDNKRRGCSYVYGQILYFG